MRSVERPHVRSAEVRQYALCRRCADRLRPSTPHLADIDFRPAGAAAERGAQCRLFPYLVRRLPGYRQSIGGAVGFRFVLHHGAGGWPVGRRRRESDLRALRCEADAVRQGRQPGHPGVELREPDRSLQRRRCHGQHAVRAGRAVLGRRERRPHGDGQLLLGGQPAVDTRSGKQCVPGERRGHRFTASAGVLSYQPAVVRGNTGQVPGRLSAALGLPDQRDLPEHPRDSDHFELPAHQPAACAVSRSTPRGRPHGHGNDRRAPTWRVVRGSPPAGGRPVQQGLSDGKEQGAGEFRRL